MPPAARTPWPQLGPILGVPAGSPLQPTPSGGGLRFNLMHTPMKPMPHAHAIAAHFRPGAA